MKAITYKLFADEKIRHRICRDYALDPSLSHEQLAEALVEAFGQNPGAGPDGRREATNQVVYRAAALALASNSRSWATFLPHEKSLAELTFGYDPYRTAAAVRAEQLTINDLAACLPGQTAGKDAHAIIRWAEMLDSTPRYHEVLRRLDERLRSEGMESAAIVPAVAVILGAPGGKTLKQFPPPEKSDTWKVHGMGPVLASEFLRNLQWAGFKPDRHVIRLFTRWFPDVIEKEMPRARALGERLGTRRKDVLEFLTFSLVGAAVTPEGKTFTEVDNLVWALGAYTEKKGKESSTVYRID
ncbi:MAG: hypothetical protein EA376_06015 [Phycisphaeraceae bacterium]|nr:MAG: hypothetical protein EA376_06015 [Phycisphaeraceae bacterium]